MSNNDPALAVCGSNVDGTTAFSAAVRNSGAVAVTLPDAGERGDLAVLCQRALQSASVRARDLVQVRVDRGPGSYIGLRVAVTLARCLGAFASAELVVIDSLAAAAAAALRGDHGLRQRRLCPVLDGRQGRLQVGAHSLGQDGVLGTSAATLVHDADFAAFLRRGDVVLADAGLGGRIAEAVRRAGAELRPMPAVRADVLFARELATAKTTAEALQPLYLAGSYVS